MSSLSLKFRLILVLSVIVSLLGAVGVTSYLTQREIQSEVAIFSGGRGINLRDFDLETSRLELEGTWDPAGVFIAKEIEVFPGRRRPKLRGAIQGLDGQRREIQMYGQSIRLPDGFDAEALSLGDRVEVTCDVEDGRWVAEKLSTKNVKESDKIKACATSWELDGLAPESLNIDGIQVSLIAKSEPGVTSALHDVETATALSLCLFELRAQAYSLVGHFRVTGDGVSGLDLEGDVSHDLDSEAQLMAARKEFEHNLTRARGDQAVRDPGASPEPNRWIAALFEQLPELDRRLERFLALNGRDLNAGRAELRTSLIPFLDGELNSRLNIYMRESEDDLGDNARSIAAKVQSTTRIAMALGVLATLTATILGYLLLRSIQRPLGLLEAAAKKIGAGDLTARVEVHSPDEFGALASAFNHMSETLALTTVSIDNLQNILDSMSGALILLTPERLIISVNQAAARLLSTRSEGLVGEAFASLCSTGSDAGLFIEGTPSKDVGELALLSGTGDEIFVSFSAAELRSSDGHLRGYVCVAQDLSDQKRIEKEVRSSLREKELLLREVHHRVKNNMQVISSLLSMQQSHSNDPSVVECLEQGQARIRSMALIHEHLYQSADLAQADVAAYLSLLVAHITRSFGSDKSIELSQNFEQLTLELDQALALGLIVNELLSNSYQHAFKQRTAGKIQLRLRKVSEQQAELIVADDGWGALPEIDSKGPSTLGLSLVHTLVEQLGGETSVSYSNGLHTCITFPYHKLQKVTQ